MRALVLDNGLRSRADYPDPAVPAGECLVKVRMAGICGTDLELAKGYMEFSGIPGHEFVGEVASRNSSMFGKRVVGEINAGCGKCEQCAKGLSRHCPNRTVLGILGRNGAFADYLTLPERNLHLVPDSVPDEMAVFVEPIAAAYEIFAQVKLSASDRILVLGDGRLGAIVAMALSAEGVAPSVAGHHGEKLAVLAKMGLRAVLESKIDERYDVVVDCTGSAAGIARVLASVRPRGTVILKSTAAASEKLNLAPAVIDEITIVGSRCGVFEPALKALTQGRIDPRPLISRTMRLEDGLEAIETAREPSAFKVLLKAA